MSFTKELSVMGLDGSEITPLSCPGCDGSCCRKGVGLHLDSTEYALLVSAGTKLSMIAPKGLKRIKNNFFGVIENPNGSVQKYGLETDCGLLDQETGLCTIHESPGLPKACRAYPAGSIACFGFRQANTTDPDERKKLKHAFYNWPDERLTM